MPSIQRPDGIIITGSPWAQYERVTVTFPSTPNTDLIVRFSTLRPPDVNQVEYLVVNKDRGGSVYNDHSATRKAWGSGFIVLRSDTANMTATILLTVPRELKVS